MYLAVEMETLVAVAQHRNQYYSHGGRANSPIRFGSLPSKGFRDVSCRTFESGAGLLPSPFKGYYGTPVSKKTLVSPKTQTPSANSGAKSKSEDAKPSKKSFKSSPIAINLKGGSKKQRPSRDNLSFSELWAGPAYSNSPPPSSLPIPKFSVKPKRTVSLELPAMVSDLNLQPMAKSAPASPTRGPVDQSIDFLRNDDFATKTLRRILNLDIADD